MRLSQTTKVEHGLFGGLSVKLFSIVACFLKVVVADTCCSGIFEIWSKLATKIFRTGDKIGPMGVPWEAKTGPRGYPPEVPTNRSQTKCAGAATSQATGSQIASNI